MEDRGDNRPAPMNLKFSAIFTGETIGSQEKQNQSPIEQPTIIGPDLPQDCLPRRRQIANQCLQP